MKTASIRIEGNIISAELFNDLDSPQTKGQSLSDFGFRQNTKIKDEIAVAWANAKDQWNIFKRKRERLAPDERGTEITRKYWIIPFLDSLEYNLKYLSKVIYAGEKTFNLSHSAENLNGFPVHSIGCNDSLDMRRDSDRGRISPHALLQDYLNMTEHLYGIVTNGIFLRVLRDSGKLVRLSYLEFNLERMLEEDLYSEFSILYRLIHSSRMPKSPGLGDECIFEAYHLNAIESGSRIREKLSSAVQSSIELLAQGFLDHPSNSKLIYEIRESRLLAGLYYQKLLKLIYRLLFLLVIEERDLVYTSDSEVQGSADHERKNRLRKIYYEYYSITRLRRLSEKTWFHDDRLEDLWISLRNTFRLFVEEKYSVRLGLYPLGGDLFSYDATDIFTESSLNNEVLLQCIGNLSFFKNDTTGAVTPVNYAGLEFEEFGSIYESLLELNGEFREDKGRFSFRLVRSTERSSSGSHYTPEELVKPLVKHSLEYLIEESRTPSPPTPLPMGEGRFPMDDGRLPMGEGGVPLYVSDDFIDYRDGSIRVAPNILEFARDLRKNQTPAEDILWEFLRNQRFLDLKFRRQHPIFHYILDFYCHSEKICIEVDGSIHDTIEQLQKDKEKDDYLTKIGIKVIRIRNEEIFENIENVLSKINNELNQGIKEPEIKYNARKQNSNQHQQKPLPLGEVGEGGEVGERREVGEGSTSGQAFTYKPSISQNSLFAKTTYRAQKSNASGARYNKTREERLLSIKICDPACGSGHILLSSARRLALEVARERTGEDQPSPVNFRRALRDVISHCIYGVDKNPLAVELCKVALWLESYNPGVPLSFLDHRIKCGDSIVGVARIEDIKKGIPLEAYKKMPGDDNDIIKSKRRDHIHQQKGTSDIFQSKESLFDIEKFAINFEMIDELPDDTLEAIERKSSLYTELRNSGWIEYKRAADLITAQFFIPKTKDKLNRIATHADLVNILTNSKDMSKLKIAEAEGLAAEKKFFHWFLEFPEVFQNDGFDCVIGNPPFLGGKRISGNFGDNYLN